MGLARIIQKLKLRYGSQETVIRTLRAMGMRVGERCRIYTTRFGTEPWLIRLGEHVGIAPDVTFVTHSANTVLQDKYDSLTDFGKIDIRDNCYIGVNATILPNVTIGPNSVVGACSVVTKDVPPETVVAGNPARPICTLAEYEQKAVSRHLDIPKDREKARAFLERHFWGDEA
jgi:acetyltransferase-like isoleucine patch superfamily enzyme